MQEEGRQFLSDGFEVFSGLRVNFLRGCSIFSVSFDYVEDYLPGLSGPWTYSKSQQTRFGYRLSLGSAICSFDHRFSDLGFRFLFLVLAVGLSFFYSCLGTCFGF